MAGSFQASLDKFARDLKQLLSVRRIAEIRRVLAAEAMDIIIKRVRDGKGIDRDDGTVQTLKPLSPRYIEHRRKNSAKLSVFTSPGRSNLTFSGEMIRSMTLREVGDRTIITFVGERASGLTNAKLAQFVAEKGRPFFHLSRDEKDKARSRAIKTWDDLVKRGQVTL